MTLKLLKKILGTALILLPGKDIVAAIALLSAEIALLKRRTKKENKRVVPRTKMTTEEALEIQKAVYESYKQRNNKDPHGFDPNLPTFWVILELDHMGYFEHLEEENP